MVARSAPAVLVMVLVGCSSESSPRGNVDDPTVSIPLCVKEYFSGLAWSGARVAVQGRDDIAAKYTNELGCATLRGLPPESESLLSITAPGLTPSLFALVSGKADSTQVRMDVPAAEWRQASAGTFAFPLDYAKGSLSVWITYNDALTVTAEGGVPGVKLRLHAPFEAGPFFNEGATSWAPRDKAATTESGIGAFFNIEPGDAEVELELPSGVECVIGYDDVWSIGGSWPAAGERDPRAPRVLMPIYAGFHTGTAIRCLR